MKNNKNIKIIERIHHIKMPDTQGISNEEFDILEEKIYKTIDYNRKDGYILTGGREWDFAWIEGNLYSRCYYEFSELPKFFSLKRKYTSDEPPHLMCECGCTTFQLRYGSYSLVAYCSNCGISESVYEG